MSKVIKTKTKKKYSLIPPKLVVNHVQVCPFCKEEIGHIMSSVSMGGLLPVYTAEEKWITGNYRFGECECGTWKTDNNLEYSGKGSINDPEVPFIKYTKKENL